MEMQVRHVGFNHYAIEPANEADRAKAEACVEGEAHEFRDLGYAIKARRDECHPRGGFVIEGEVVYFYNPAQPHLAHITTLAEADILAGKLMAI